MIPVTPRREIVASTLARDVSAPTAVSEPRHTPLQQTAGKVCEAAYAAGAIGGAVIAGSSLVAVAGLIATGIIDHANGTNYSSFLLTHADTFTAAMRGGVVYLGSCAAVMVASLGTFGLSALAQRLRRAST